MEVLRNIWEKYKNDIIIHVIFWIYITLQTLSAVTLSEETKIDFGFFWDLFLNMFTFYCFYILLVLVFPKTKSKYLNIVIGLIGLTLFTIIRYELVYYYNIWFKQIEADKIMSFTKTLHYHVRMVVITSIYALLIKFASDWFKTQRMRTDLINQNQISELSMLRAQISPHFFFNTLNNIYALVYKKSDEAPEVVMKLSDIMRYMLYEANTDRVPLNTEIDYLKSYIELQLLRFRQSNAIDFKTEGDIDEKQIPPMLLIPFVENAFKHCDKSVHPCIFIHLKSAKDYLYFVVTNFKKNSITTTEKDKASGIGMQNIKRRLQLLFPSKHKLKVSEEDNKYTIELILEI